jgi:hypothetical protein
MVLRSASPEFGTLHLFESHRPSSSLHHATDLGHPPQTMQSDRSLVFWVGWGRGRLLVMAVVEDFADAATCMADFNQKFSKIFKKATPQLAFEWKD